MAVPKDPDPSQSLRVMLGSELRHARLEAGLSQEAVGEPLFVSGSYIAKLENGTRRMPHEMACQFDEMFSTNGFFARNCVVANRSKYPDHFAEAADAEAIATKIKQYAPLLIPGLLQTEDYARAVFRAHHPTATDEAINRLVTARMERARILGDPATPLVWMVLDEAALRRQVGGAGVMARSIQHMAKLARANRVIVQVLPFAAGCHAAMEGLLKLMSFEDAPPLSYIEGPGAGHLEDDPATVARHELTYQLITASALPPRESLVLIESVAEEYGNEAQL
ncbi:helix-turn-helix domain-containing protein [Streptomyces sp. NPDC004609]|uniref:helix-turn-helix domain-containing protein n=1 Tax=Streptomyces sp. NPDC004609 TaxID=3364704 RepID=UPI0036A4BA3B